MAECLPVTQANEIKYTQINSERKTLEKESSKPNITPVAEDAIIVQPNQLQQNTDSMGQVIPSVKKECYK
ncbi:MAG: hypothetical protein F6K39_18890 [Okeania sp. SIO3B3]|nr:hypothetical protein [Okeania sp. SIO3B3]